MILLLSGCVASLDMGRATPLPEGSSRVGFGTELQLMRADQRPGEATVPAPWIQATAGWHYGLAPGWEVGVRGWGMDIPLWFGDVGLAVEAKRAVHASKRRDDPNVAVLASAWWHAPTLGGSWWHVAGVTVPVLFGWDIKRSQLVLSPRVMAGVGGSYGQAPVPAVGIGAGLAWDIAAGKHLHVTPEVAWTWSPLGFDGEVSDPDRVGARNFETGVGVSWER